MNSGKIGTLLCMSFAKAFNLIFMGEVKRAVLAKKMHEIVGTVKLELKNKIGLRTPLWSMEFN